MEDIMNNVDLELKDLALFFFKREDISPEKAYTKALSFLNIKKNYEGRDIVGKEVKYNFSNIEGKIYWAFIIEGEKSTVRVIGDYSNLGLESKTICDYIDNKLISKINKEKEVLGEVSWIKDESMVVSTEYVYLLACMF